MYRNIYELCKLSEDENKPVWQVILENEMKHSGVSEKEIFDALEDRLKVMEASASKALTRPFETVGRLITGISSQQYSYASDGQTVCGSFINEVMAMALSCCEINASMGKICAAPTAGSCGIIPAVLIGMARQFDIQREDTLKAMLVASGVGAVITKNATVSGSEGGCQAECGTAAAMASAAVVWERGGSNLMIANSISFVLMNVMGLVCDPVAGLVQVPCAARNASQAVNALLCADLALSGMDPVIPADEAIEAMYKTGRALPFQLRETAMGGIAATKTAKQISKDIFDR